MQGLLYENRTLYWIRPDIFATILHSISVSVIVGKFHSIPKWMSVPALGKRNACVSRSAFARIVFEYCLCSQQPIVAKETADLLLTLSNNLLFVSVTKL